MYFRCIGNGKSGGWFKLEGGEREGGVRLLFVVCCMYVCLVGG